MNADTLLENFEILAEAPGGIDRLREVILALATQGKLFRDTDLTKWQLDVTLKDFGRMIRGITYAKAESSKEPAPNFVPLLGAANIQRSINYEGLTFVASSLIKPDQYLKDGDVLICMSSGSKHLVGKAGIVRNPPASSFGAFCGVFRISDEKNRDYLAMLFKSPMYRTAISVASRGIGINNLRVGDIESIAFSLPPLAEQKRIVAKVDELMALCDQLEQQQKHRDNLRTATRRSAIDAISTATSPEELETAWKRINNNWEVIADTPESVESLRSLILELAVSGKLIQGVGSWDELTLGQVTKIRTGKLDANASSPEGEYPFFTCAKSPLKISTFSYDTECVLLAGNGNFDVNYYSGKFDAYQRTYIIEAKNKDELFIPYLFRFMQGHSKKLLEQSIGGVIKYIKIGFLTDAPLLLPSYSEQEQIVSKVEELMALCDQLEVELKVRSEVAEKFARSVVNAA